MMTVVTAVMTTAKVLMIKIDAAAASAAAADAAEDNPLCLSQLALVVPPIARLSLVPVTMQFK